MEPPSRRGSALCFSSSALIPDGRFSYGVTALCCVLTLLPFAPQYIKFCLRRSAEGVSQVTLALVVFCTWLQVLNLLVLHWEQLSACLAAAQPGRCDHSLTTLVYVTVSLLGSAPLLPVALALTPPGPERDAGLRLLALLCLAVIATGLPVATGLAGGGGCAPLALYAALLGASCALLYVLVYAPQLIYSLQYKAAGALSYGFLALHLLLGVGSAAQKALGTHERVVTWLPPLSANAMQALIIAVNLHYDCGGAEREGRAEEEAAPLEALQARGYGAAGGGGGGKGGEEGVEGVGARRRGQGLRERAAQPPLFSREWWDRYL